MACLLPLLFLTSLMLFSCPAVQTIPLHGLARSDDSTRSAVLPSYGLARNDDSTRNKVFRFNGHWISYDSMRNAVLPSNGHRRNYDIERATSAPSEPKGRYLGNSLGTFLEKQRHFYVSEPIVAIKPEYYRCQNQDVTGDFIFDLKCLKALKGQWSSWKQHLCS